MNSWYIADFLTSLLRFLSPTGERRGILQAPALLFLFFLLSSWERGQRGEVSADWKKYPGFNYLPICVTRVHNFFLPTENTVWTVISLINEIYVIFNHGNHENQKNQSSDVIFLINWYSVLFIVRYIRLSLLKFQFHFIFLSDHRKKTNPEKNYRNDSGFAIH